MWSLVNGVEIVLTSETIYKAIKVPIEGAHEWNLEYDEYEAYSIMTKLLANPDDDKQAQLTSFNTNTFPPLKR